MGTIYSGKGVGDIWVRRTKQKLEKLYSNAILFGIMKVHSVRWMGHVLRMKKQRGPKRVVNSRVGGVRGRQRPIKRISGGAGKNWQTQRKSRIETS